MTIFRTKGFLRRMAKREDSKGQTLLFGDTEVQSKKVPSRKTAKKKVSELTLEEKEIRNLIFEKLSLSKKIGAMIGRERKLAETLFKKNPNPAFWRMAVKALAPVDTLVHLLTDEGLREIGKLSAVFNLELPPPKLLPEESLRKYSAEVKKKPKTIHEFLTCQEK